MFNPANFDPSKMDPKVMMEMSRLIQQLPPEKLSRMQTLMHNMMAGFDVKKELEEFENSLPPGFREKLMALTMQAQASQNSAASQSAPIDVTPEKSAAPAAPTTVDEARLTILRAVSENQITPEQALAMLFPPET